MKPVSPFQIDHERGGNLYTLATLLKAWTLRPFGCALQIRETTSPLNIALLIRPCGTLLASPMLKAHYESLPARCLSRWHGDRTVQDHLRTGE